MKQISYAESRGEKPFDWNEFLNRETITEEEWKEADKLANNWVTCACGNQCDVIPRGGYKILGDGCPVDRALCMLGSDFSYSIGDRNKKLSLSILHGIEKRSAELIAELTKK